MCSNQRHQTSKILWSAKPQRCPGHLKSKGAPIKTDMEGILKTDDDSCQSESSRETQTQRKKVFTKRRIDRKSRRSNLFRIHGATTTDTEEFYLSSSSVLTDVIVSPDGTRQFKFEFKGTPRSSGETTTVGGRNQSGRQASNPEGVQQQSSMRPGQEELQGKAQPEIAKPDNVIEAMFKPWKSELEQYQQKPTVKQEGCHQQYKEQNHESPNQHIVVQPRVSSRVRPRAPSATTAHRQRETHPFDMGALREELKQYQQISTPMETVHTLGSQVQLRVQSLHGASSASEYYPIPSSGGTRPGVRAASTDRSTYQGRGVPPHTLRRAGNIAESNRQPSRRRRSIFELCEDLCSFCSNTSEEYFVSERDLSDFLPQRTLSESTNIRDPISEQPTSENNFTHESTWL